MLPLLRLFSFVPTENRSPPNEWKSMSAELQLALLRVFTLPSLRICKLEGIDNLPRESFSSSEHLKQLSLVEVSIGQDPLGLSAPSVGSKKVQPESLVLSDISDDDALFGAIGSVPTTGCIGIFRAFKCCLGSKEVRWKHSRGISTLNMVSNSIHWRFMLFSSADEFFFSI
jgi:hypothetical protein